MSLTEKIIENVKKHPILYMSHSEYRDIRHKDRIWDQLGEALDEEGETIKNKWKNLRDTYAKYLKSLKTSTGQSAKKNYKRWQWAQQMQFLQPFMQFAQTHSNVRPSEEDNSIDVENTDTGPEIEDVNDDNRCSAEDKTVKEMISAPSATTPTPDKSTKSRKRKASENTDAVRSSVQEVIKYLEHKPRKVEHDALDLLFLSYAKTVRSFSPRRQAKMKMRVAQVIGEEELAHIDENPSSRQPSYLSTSRTSSSASGMLSPLSTYSGVALSHSEGTYVHDLTESHRQQDESRFINVQSSRQSTDCSTPSRIASGMLSPMSIYSGAALSHSEGTYLYDLSAAHRQELPV